MQLSRKTPALLLAALLAGGLVLAGDRSLITKNPAKPNVMIILDTSGSMVGGSDVDLVAQPASVDDPASKIAISKRVLRKIINNTQTANFGFTHFRQNFAGSPLTINGKFTPGSTLFKQWLYIAGNQQGGAPNPWSGPGTELVLSGAPLQFGAYLPFGPSGCNTYYPLFASGQSPSTIATGVSPSTAPKGFGVNASDKWIVYHYPSGGFQGDSTRRLKMQILSGTYSEPSIFVSETVQQKIGSTWVDTATSYIIAYTVASDPRYPTTDANFGWDGSFVEHSYAVNCDASSLSSYKYQQFSASFNSPGNNPQWEYFPGSTLKPRIPIQCDSCPNNRPEIERLMRPVGKLIGYDKLTGVYTLLEDPLQALTGFGNTPIAASLAAARNYFTQDTQFTADPLKTCRKNFVILITDGNETAGGTPCTVATTLGTAKVPVFVISFGSGANPVTNACIATNSGGKAYAADNEQELLDALNDIFTKRIEVTSAFAAASVPTVQIESQSTAYLASFVPHQKRSIWSGTLRAYKLDPATGLPPGDPATGLPLQDKPDDPDILKRRPLWDAARVLGATDPLAALSPGAAAAPMGSPAVTAWPGRKLVWGLPGAAGVPNPRQDFLHTLSDPQWSVLKGLLNESDNAAAQSLIRFLRGNRDVELKSRVFPDLVPGNDARSYLFADKPDYAGATVVPAYNHKLGDIFHSDPGVSANPLNFAYFQRDLNGYEAFARQHAKRRRVLFVGANDGFLHAFETGVWGRDTTNFPQTWDQGSGRELFGFAPRGSLAKLKNTFASFVSIAPYEYSADGPLSVEDAFIDNEFAPAPNPAKRAWRTVLVGGLRQGGDSVFALDVTQPDLLNADGTIAGNSDAAPACLNGALGCGGAGKNVEYPRILWEIGDTASPAMGETWSRPTAGRMEFWTGLSASGPAPPQSNNFHPCRRDTAKGCEDKYVAIFGGGFDPSKTNTVGRSLYVVDIETGSVLYKGTSGKDGTGAVATFGSIPAAPGVADPNDDGYLDILYVGDLKGQVWRVDLSPDLTGATNRGQLISGKANYFPFLLFDAGVRSGCVSPCFRPFYFEPTIVLVSVSPSGQKTLGVGLGSGDRSYLLDNANNPQRFYFIVDAANTTTKSESNLTGFDVGDPPVAGLLANGWFLRYPTATEKTTTPALSQAGFLVFTTFRLATDPCEPAGFSRIYAVNYANGSPVPGKSRMEDIADPGAALGISGSVTQKGEIISVIQIQEGSLVRKSSGTSVATSIRDWKEQ